MNELTRGYKVSHLNRDYCSDLVISSRRCACYGSNFRENIWL